MGPTPTDHEGNPPSANPTSDAAAPRAGLTLPEGSGPQIDELRGSHCEVVSSDRPPGVPAKTQRIEGYDIIRILAAFNIVLSHAVRNPSGLIGRGGVPAFLMIAASIPAMKADLGPFGPYARNRIRRVGVPWLFWSAFYGIVAVLWYLAGGNLPNWTVHWVFIGTMVHLWFFPYVLVAGLGLWWLLEGLRNVKPQMAAFGLAAVAALLILLCALVLDYTWPVPYGEWLMGLPGFLVGIAFGLACRIPDQASRRRTIVIAGGITLAAAIGALALGSPQMTLSFAPGAILVPAALLLPIHSGRAIRGFAAVSMGVYATHPFVAMVLRRLTGNSWPLWLSVPTVFVGAIAFSMAIKRTSWGKNLV
jgi:peptidoglycan/LPS O-acetylase OafA/YrhL